MERIANELLRIARLLVGETYMLDGYSSTEYNTVVMGDGQLYVEVKGKSWPVQEKGKAGRIRHGDKVVVRLPKDKDDYALVVKKR